MLQNCHKCKTNPKRTQTNPIFPRPKPILNPKIGIFDKFRKHFLCKTNPMVCYRYSNFSLMNNDLFPFLARIFGSDCHSGLDPESILSCPSCHSWLSKYFQKTLNIPNKPNLNNFLIWLTKGIKRTYSDFYQKDVKKTKPILTLS